MGTLDSVWYANYGNGSSTGWWGVTQWANITASAGQVIRQFTAPAQNAERVFVCIVGGATGSTEPTWVLTRGAKNTSSSAVYQECTGIAALNGDALNTVNWSTYHSVNGTTGTLGQVIKDGAGTHIFIMSTAGTIGSVEPTWNTSAFGNTTADNGATWTYVGTASGNTTSFTAWGAPMARLAMVQNGTTWIAAGHTVYYGSASTESFTGAIQMTWPGTVTNPNYVLAINTGGNVPPQSTDVTTGATFASTNNFSIAGSLFSQGVSYANGGTNTSFNISNTGSTGVLKLKNGNLNFGGSTGNTFSTCSGGIAQIDLIGYPWVALGAGAGNTWTHVSGEYNWYNSSPSVLGPFTTAIIASGSAGRMFFEGVDFGSVSGTFGPVGQPGVMTFKDCKASSSAWPPGPAAVNWVTNETNIIRTDSGANNWIQRRLRLNMSHIADNTVFRAGGATDGVTKLSWKFPTPATTSGNLASPWFSHPMRIWNNKVGSVTVSIYGTWAGLTAPTNDIWWIDIVYYNSSTDPDSTYFSTGLDIPSSQSQTLFTQTLSGFNTATSWPVDNTSSWTGGSTTNFVMSATLTINQVGYLFVTAAYGGGTGNNQNLWIDPEIVLS